MKSKSISMHSTEEIDAKVSHQHAEERQNIENMEIKWLLQCGSHFFVQRDGINHQRDERPGRRIRWRC